MNKQPSLESRRMGVTIHYALVMALMIYVYVMLYTLRGQITPIWTIIVGLVLLTAAIISFVRVFVKTRLWRFTWGNDDSLDEREILVTRTSFRRSYRVFVSIALAIAVLLLVVENSYFSAESFNQLRSFNAVQLMFALVHFAKTLPSAMLAWTEKEIPRE